jgi:hypothetical protein
MRVPMARCRIGEASGDDSVQRYVPLSELGLWRYLMENRHRKRVTIEAISVWVPEEPALWNSGYAPEDLEPVLRIEFSVRGQHGALIPVERYFPALSYPKAQEALFSHYTSGSPSVIRATAGYFLPLTCEVSATRPEA